MIMVYIYIYTCYWLFPRFLIRLLFVGVPLSVQNLPNSSQTRCLVFNNLKPSSFPLIKVPAPIAVIIFPGFYGSVLVCTSVIVISCMIRSFLVSFVFMIIVNILVWYPLHDAQFIVMIKWLVYLYFMFCCYLFSWNKICKISPWHIPSICTNLRLLFVNLQILMFFEFSQIACLIRMNKMIQCLLKGVPYLLK